MCITHRKYARDENAMKDEVTYQKELPAPPSKPTISIPSFAQKARARSKHFPPLSLKKNTWGMASSAASLPSLLTITPDSAAEPVNSWRWVVASAVSSNSTWVTLVAVVVVVVPVAVEPVTSLLCCCFFLTSCSALLISSRVTPCVERLVSRTRFACALRCVSLSSSRTGGTNDLWDRTAASAVFLIWIFFLALAAAYIAEHLERYSPYRSGCPAIVLQGNTNFYSSFKAFSLSFRCRIISKCILLYTIEIICYAFFF